MLGVETACCLPDARQKLRRALPPPFLMDSQEGGGRFDRFPGLCPHNTLRRSTLLRVAERSLERFGMFDPGTPVLEICGSG